MRKVAKDFEICGAWFTPIDRYDDVTSVKADYDDNNLYISHFGKIYGVSKIIRQNDKFYFQIKCDSIECYDYKDNYEVFTRSNPSEDEVFFIKSNKEAFDGKTIKHYIPIPSESIKLNEDIFITKCDVVIGSDIDKVRKMLILQ